MKRTSLAMLTALVCTLAPLTIKQAYAQAADASAQLDRFSVFVGDWNCTGKELAHGKTPAHATTARLHGEQAVGGQWILIRYDEDKTAANPKPFHVDQYFGYDSTRKQFVTVAAGNFGYFSGASPGWSGNSITFDEPADGKSLGSRDSFTRNGQNEISHSGTGQDKDGKWIKSDEETCHRMQFDVAAESQKLLQRDAEWADTAAAGKDLDKIVSYWSDDAIVVEPGEPIHEGKAAIRAYVAESLKTPGFKIHWVSEKPIFSPDGKMAYMRGVDEMTVPGPKGALMTLHYRGISIWRRDPDGVWRCVVDISNEAPPASDAH